MTRMRALLTSVTCPKGEIDANLGRHLDLVRLGAKAQCDLVLLPEMSLTGYQPGAAISLDHPALSAIARATEQGPACCFGLVEHAGSGLPYITQVVTARGEIAVVHRKAHLGDGEDALFQPGTPAAVFQLCGVPCSLAVCAEIGTSAPYRTETRVVLGPSAPGLYGDRRARDEDWRAGFEWWRGSVLDDAARLLAAGQVLAVSTQAGATADEDFPGWAALIGADGGVIAALPDWREGELIVDLPR